MPKQDDYAKYAYIVAWHRLTGSMDYYVEARVNEAKRDNAPETAIYKRDRWYTIDECADPERPLIQAVHAAAENIRSH